jgi:glutathione S-transferase
MPLTEAADAALVLYTHPWSRGQIARWMLEEVGEPYRQVLLDFGSTMKAPDYLTLNPLGKVPTVVHRGQVVTECAAICAYLADAFPAAGLAPAPSERAAYYRWLFFAAGRWKRPSSTARSRWN